MRLTMAILLSLLLPAIPAHAQQSVRVKVDGGSPELRVDIPGQLYRSAAVRQAPAVALFHGCGGVGANNTRMAELLKSWGYVALVVDSFSSRGLKDVCGRHWPTQADAEKRAVDIDAAGLWLDRQDFVKPSQRAIMGYSNGGGVGLLRRHTSARFGRLRRIDSSKAPPGLGRFKANRLRTGIQWATDSTPIEARRTGGTTRDRSR